MPRPAVIVELLKPVTWFAPMWAYGCGVLSIAGVGIGSWSAAVAGLLLAGPLVCGASQAANDWFDRHVDAINEPERPVPSGRMPGRWGIGISVFCTAISLLVASRLGPWVFAAACTGLLLGWAYSAPPIRLKRNGWLSSAVCGLCYEGLPWFTGAAAVSAALPNAKIIALAALYSVGAHGIMTLNDFKSVEGDRALGLRSLPVTLGVERAAHVACAMMAAPQALVVALLVWWQRPAHAAVVALLLLGQLGLMTRLVAAPRERAAWYNATGTTLYVLGMLAGALAVRSMG